VLGTQPCRATHTPPAPTHHTQEAEDRAERGSRLWHAVFKHAVAAGEYLR
jgi:hypothetical protein